MNTREIPRTEWAAFFDSFSRRHEGWRATLDFLGPDIGEQIEERELIFESVTAELSDTGDKIEILIGFGPDDHVTHTINDPERVSLEQTEEGADVALAIKEAGGETTLLRFPLSMLSATAGAVTT